MNTWNHAHLLLSYDFYRCHLCMIEKPDGVRKHVAFLLENGYHE